MSASAPLNWVSDELRKDRRQFIFFWLVTHTVVFAISLAVGFLAVTNPWLYATGVAFAIFILSLPPFIDTLGRRMNFSTITLEYAGGGLIGWALGTVVLVGRSAVGFLFKTNWNLLTSWQASLVVVLFSMALALLFAFLHDEGFFNEFLAFLFVYVIGVHGILVLGFSLLVGWYAYGTLQWKYAATIAIASLILSGPAYWLVKSRPDYRPLIDPPVTYYWVSGLVGGIVFSLLGAFAVRHGLHLSPEHLAFLVAGFTIGVALYLGIRKYKLQLAAQSKK